MIWIKGEGGEAGVEDIISFPHCRRQYADETMKDGKKPSCQSPTILFYLTKDQWAMLTDPPKKILTHPPCNHKARLCYTMPTSASTATANYFIDFMKEGKTNMLKGVNTNINAQHLKIISTDSTKVMFIHSYLQTQTSAPLFIPIPLSLSLFQWHIILQLFT